MKIKARERVETTPMYQGGLPIELVSRERGIDVSRIVKLASNENPLGPSPKAMEAVAKAIPELHRYPDGGSWELTGKLAAIHGLTREHFILGNGSNEVIELLGQSLLEPGTNVVMGQYPFVVYPLVTHHFGAEARKVPMPDLRHNIAAMLDAIDANTRLLCIASPNNPTPLHNSPEELMDLLESIPDHVVLCIDAAYTEYISQAPDFLTGIRSERPVIVLRTFSKVYGLAGLRIGYGMACPSLIQLLQRTRQPFNVNSLAQKAALAALDDGDFVRKSLETNRSGLLQLETGLKDLGFPTVIGETNFILVKVESCPKACDFLLNNGVIVRSMEPFGLSGMIRVSVGTAGENERFLETLANFPR